MTNLSKLINKAVEEFDKKFAVDSNGGVMSRGITDGDISDYELVKSFLTKCIQETYQMGREETIKETSEEIRNLLENKWKDNIKSSENYWEGLTMVEINTIINNLQSVTNKEKQK